jgi:hypothetical protein
LGLAAGTSQGSKGSRAKDNGPGETKADVAVAAVGPDEVAVRRPAVVSADAPATAANYAISAPWVINPGTPVFRRTFVITVSVILHPLPDIAVHVIKPEAIGLYFTDRMKLLAGIFITPSNLLKILFGISFIKPCVRIGPTGILPLCLGRQPQLYRYAGHSAWRVLLWVAFYILRAEKGLSLEVAAETFLKPLFKT